MTWKVLGPAALALGIMTLLPACSDDAPPQEASPVTQAAAPPESSALSDAVGEQTAATCTSVSALAAANTAFLEEPQAESLATARKAWQTAHTRYRTLAFIYRWADRPMPQINNDRDPIDAQPLLPGYLDQVPGYPSSGLAFSEVPLTPDFLRKEHQSTDFYYLTLGFHPIESLLWPTGTDSVDQVLARFDIDPATPADKINVPQRRHDLLRLMTTALKRDVQTLCDTRNTAYLLAGLAPLEAGEAAAQLEKSLTASLDASLGEWLRQPEGEDDNGMPVAHSPQALTDFHEWAQMIRVVATDWLPVLLAKDDVEEKGELGSQLGTLADQLDTIDLTRKPVSTAAIKEARQTLNQVSESLTQRALRANGQP